MRSVMLAINLLKSYNEKANDDRFTAIIDILESIMRDEAKKDWVNPIHGYTQIQRDLLKAAMDNMGIDSVQFEGGQPINRRDLDENDEEERNS